MSGGISEAGLVAKQLRFGKSADHGDRWKTHLRERAQALFPQVEVTLKTADALLILEAGRTAQHM